MEVKKATYFTDRTVVINVILKYIFRALFFFSLLIFFGVLAIKYKNLIPESLNPNFPWLETIAFVISFLIFAYFLPFSKNFRIKSIIKKMGFNTARENIFFVSLEKQPCDHDFWRRFFDKTDDIGLLYLGKEYLEYSGDQYYFKMPYEDLVGMKRVGLSWMRGVNRGKRTELVFLHEDERVHFIINDRSKSTSFATANANDYIWDKLQELSVPDIYANKAVIPKMTAKEASGAPVKKKFSSLKKSR